MWVILHPMHPIWWMAFSSDGERHAEKPAWGLGMLRRWCASDLCIRMHPCISMWIHRKGFLLCLCSCFSNLTCWFGRAVQELLIRGARCGHVKCKRNAACLSDRNGQLCTRLCQSNAAQTGCYRCVCKFILMVFYGLCLWCISFILQSWFTTNECKGCEVLLCRMFSI